ncbi:MAG: alpha/beta hydrolase [Betaproteobacteria bacterium]|nr:alpha/beta hydrolase [Betaproteobacteria bacterium]
MNAPDSLEVLSKIPGGKQPVHETPLLFIHGAYTAAWCWEEHFLPWFASKGYVSHAVSLSGHGASRGRKQIDSFSINNYVDDVATVVDALPVPPVLIGHSMGGFVVQKYLERSIQESSRGAAGSRPNIPAAVLMCAVPPQGLMSSAFGLMFQKPGLMSELNNLMGGRRVSVDTLREALFAQPLSEADLQRYLRYSQRESHRAIWDMTLFNLPHPSRIKDTPLLVLGADLDHLIPAALVSMTASTYGVQAQIFPGMGHGLMLERDWQTVAEHIRAWLDQREI